MAALTATHWTEVVNNRFIEGKHKRNDITLTLATTGAAFYPTSGVGIPLPTTMGMVRNIDYIKIYSNDQASGIIWKYNPTGHTVRGYWNSGPTSTANATPVALGELPTTWTPSDFAAAVVLYIEAVGW
jgi:hypothetical protein